MHVAASLAAHIQSRSLVLFDEPETHLHPPLLAALMHTLRRLLSKRKAFAVIATHSPVVLQETLGRHVLVVRRTGEEVVTEPPALETFGENTGTITHDVFGLSSDATDYHRQLDELIRVHKAIDPIERLFDRGLSHQARAYVMSKLAAGSED
jgi:ABC-type glutathione transport system ATPase component